MGVTHEPDRKGASVVIRYSCPNPNSDLGPSILSDAPSFLSSDPPARSLPSPVRIGSDAFLYRLSKASGCLASSLITPCRKVLAWASREDKSIRPIRSQCPFYTFRPSLRFLSLTVPPPVFPPPPPFLLVLAPVLLLASPS